MTFTLATILQLGGILIALLLAWGSLQSNVSQLKENNIKLEGRLEHLESVLIGNHVEELNKRLRTR